MAGISSEAAKGNDYPLNKKKYNGIDWQNDLGLNEYDAQLRDLDPQIGIWWQIDPKVEDMEMWSPYTSNYDNPIKYSDLLGDEPDGECCGGLWKALSDAGNNIMASASGMLFGALNTISGGVISTDPFGTRRTLTSEQKMYWDNGVTVMQAAQMMPIPGGGRRPVTETPEYVPANASKFNPKIGPGSTEPIVPDRVNSKSNSKANDLIRDPYAPPGTYDNKPAPPKVKNRVVDQKPGEAALNQSEGLNNAKDAAAKNKAVGQSKQTKINETKKTEDRLKNVNRTIKTSKDIDKNY